MSAVKSIKIITKGNASVSLVNDINKDMIYNHDEYFNKVIVRGKSITVSFRMMMDEEAANNIAETYQSWYDAECILGGIK